MCYACHGCAFILGSLFCTFLLHYRLKMWFIYFLNLFLREEFEIGKKILLKLHAYAGDKRAGPVFVHTNGQVKLPSSLHCSWGAMHRADTGHSVFLPTCWKHSDETLQYWKQSLCSSRTHGTGHNFSSVRKKNEITFWGLRPWFFGKFPWLHMKYQSTLSAKQREPNSWHTLVTPILTLAWWERQTLCQKAGKFVQVHIQKALEAQHQGMKQGNKYLFLDPFFSLHDRKPGCLPGAIKCRKAAKAPDSWTTPHPLMLKNRRNAKIGRRTTLAMGLPIWKGTNQHTYDKSIAVTEVLPCKNPLLKDAQLPFVSLACCAPSDSSPRGVRAVIYFDLLIAGANMLDSQHSPCSWISVPRWAFLLCLKPHN